MNDGASVEQWLRKTHSGFETNGVLSSWAQ